MADFIDMDSAKTAGVGHIVRIIGAVVDVKFKGGVPNIYNALTVDVDTPVGHIDTILEVESQLPGDVVRCVAMTSTDGLQRGLEVVDTGAPMKMPVGKGTLGRIWNVMGQPVDGKEMPGVDDWYPIHHAAPSFDQLTTKTEIFETGIKAVDLICRRLAAKQVRKESHFVITPRVAASRHEKRPDQNRAVAQVHRNRAVLDTARVWSGPRSASR